MAKKDKQLKNKSNETVDGQLETVFEDKPLEKKDVEELEQDFSSIFNEDYEEDDEEEEWEEYVPRGIPFLPFLGKKEKNYETPKEKKTKDVKKPKKNKAEDKEKVSEEKVEEIKETTIEETVVKEEKKEKKPLFSWGKKEKTEAAEEIINEEKDNEIVEENSQPEEVVEETVIQEEQFKEILLFDEEEDEESLIDEVEEDTETDEEATENADEETIVQEEIIEGLKPFEEKIEKTVQKEENEDVSSVDEPVIQIEFNEIPSIEETDVQIDFKKIVPFEETAKEISVKAENEEKPSLEKNEETETVEISEEKTSKKFVLPWKAKKRKSEKQEFQEIENVEEIVVQEDVIEELKSFEETTEENAVQKDVIEELKPFEETVVQEKVIEEFPPFEATTVKTEFKEIPPFEETVVQTEFKEIPPFEETVVQTEFKEIPPFEETEGIKETTTEETVAKEEKKERKPLFSRRKKEKTETAEETVDEEKQTEKETEPLTKKDHLTFALAIIALIMAIAFVLFKFFPMGNESTKQPENVVETSKELSEIQIKRQGTANKYIPSGVKDVFYSISAENKVEYYHYENKALVPVQAEGTLDAKVRMGKSNLSVTIDYVNTNDGVFGISIFRSEDNPGSTIHNVITFKLVDLPEKYKAEGKALLLAVANSESASENYNLWTDSFIVDIKTGATTRFLTEDQNTNSYSVAYSVLTNSAYISDGDMIPFFTTRAYGGIGGQKDLFVMNGTKESLFATDVYGEYIYADSSMTSYLKATETGFNVVKKENSKEEKTVFSLYGSFSTDYLYHNEYILNKLNGNLYNVKTGEEIPLAGYRMSNADMISVSADGRYLVVLGTVDSVADYQVHIFDLKKSDYAKYEDLNFSQHSNLVFVDNTKVMYMVVDPNQGYENVILDVSKAF